MSIDSRQKGKRGELEIVHKLSEYGYDCRRGQQYCGSNGDADVVGVPGLHIEIKRVERLNVENALKQAESDCKAGIPIVMHRANGEKWKVTIRLDQFMEVWNTRTPDIVRCGECKFWRHSEECSRETIRCWRMYLNTSESDFCSYGQRKEAQSENI